MLLGGRWDRFWERLELGLVQEIGAWRKGRGGGELMVGKKIINGRSSGRARLIRRYGR